MTAVDQFTAKLGEGHAAEVRIAVAFFMAECPVQRANRGAAMDLVVTANNRPWTVEVKNEDRYADSANIILEYYQGKQARRPSGLSVTESHICIHTLGDMAVAYRTQPMRVFLKANKARYPVRDFGAADNGNGGIKFPIRDGAPHLWFAYCRIEELPECQVFKAEGEETPT